MKLQLYIFSVLSLIPTVYSLRPESKNTVDFLPLVENQTVTLRDFCHQGVP